jgi:hypothetical protein
MNCSTKDGVNCATHTGSCVEKSGRGKKCGRPAQTHKLSKHGVDLGMLDLCPSHRDQHRARGYTLVVVEKAKGAAA